jgi:hypothetical protein
MVYYGEDKAILVEMAVVSSRIDEDLKDIDIAVFFQQAST